MYPTIPKGNMGYDQYTVPDDCSCRTYFCCFPLALANTFPWPFVPILSNFFEKKKRTQNHPQCLSGLSRALFPTTFLEIAVLLTFIAFIETICSKIWTKEPHKNAKTPLRLRENASEAQSRHLRAHKNLSSGTMRAY